MNVTFPARLLDGWRVCVCACVRVPADAAVVRCAEPTLELVSQSQAVCVHARVRVVKDQNHQQEKHINQEILKLKKQKTKRHQDQEANSTLLHQHHLPCSCSCPPSAWCAACGLCGPAVGPGTEQIPEGVSPWRHAAPPAPLGGTPPARPGPPGAADAHTLRNKPPHTPPVRRSGTVKENTAQQGVPWNAALKGGEICLQKQILR